MLDFSWFLTFCMDTFFAILEVFQPVISFLQRHIEIPEIRNWLIQFPGFSGTMMQLMLGSGLYLFLVVTVIKWAKDIVF